MRLSTMTKRIKFFLHQWQFQLSERPYNDKRFFSRHQGEHSITPRLFRILKASTSAFTAETWLLVNTLKVSNVHTFTFITWLLTAHPLSAAVFTTVWETSWLCTKNLWLFKLLIAIDAPRSDWNLIQN